MIIPDFEAWAKVIYYTHPSIQDIAHDLRDVFMKGMAVGAENGYRKGVDQGWVDIQDKDIKWINQWVNEHKKPE